MAKEEKETRVDVRRPSLWRLSGGGNWSTTSNWKGTNSSWFDFRLNAVSSRFLNCVSVCLKVKDGYRTAVATGWKTRVWSSTRMRRIRQHFTPRPPATECCPVWENTGFICTTVVLRWDQVPSSSSVWYVLAYQKSHIKSEISSYLLIFVRLFFKHEICFVFCCTLTENQVNFNLHCVHTVQLVRTICCESAVQCDSPSTSCEWWR